jgi:hypothetical protein
LTTLLYGENAFDEKVGGLIRIPSTNNSKVNRMSTIPLSLPLDLGLTHVYLAKYYFTQTAKLYCVPLLRA